MEIPDCWPVAEPDGFPDYHYNHNENHLQLCVKVENEEVLGQ